MAEAKPVPSAMASPKSVPKSATNCDKINFSNIALDTLAPTETSNKFSQSLRELIH